MRSLFPVVAGCWLSLARASLALGCTRDGSSNPLDPGAPMLAAGAMPPAGHVSVNLAGSPLSLWPYTGSISTPNPKTRSTWSLPADDPRTLRARSLRWTEIGRRSGCPMSFPSTCTWFDAIGISRPATRQGRLDWQRNSAGLWQLWSDSIPCPAVRCRPGDPGERPFEVLIPGTTDHQVLSWEVAEQLIQVDLWVWAARCRQSGWRHRPDQRGSIIPGDSRADYNGIPEALKQLIGGPSGTVARRSLSEQTDGPRSSS